MSNPIKYENLYCRMLKLSKGGEKDKADVINQMLMPLHGRYAIYPAPDLSMLSSFCTIELH